MLPAILVSESEHDFESIPSGLFQDRISYCHLTKLIALVEKDYTEDNSCTSDKGKKRASTPPSGPSKRRKTDGNVAKTSDHSTSRRVFQHTLTLLPGVASREEKSRSAIHTGFSQDREEHISALKKWNDRNLGITLDLGPVGIQAENNNLALTYEFDDVEGNVKLLSIPDIPTAVDLDAFDFSARYHNLLVACIALKRAGKISIECSLSLVSLSASDRATVRNSDPPFKALVEINVNILFPAILEPIDFIHYSPSYSIGEAQRRLFLHVFPPSQPQRTIDIPFFYSFLQQAPALSSVRQERFAQPPKLLPNLLPFQRRTTHRLLNFEGKEFNSEGRISLLSDESRRPSDAIWKLVHIPTAPQTGTSAPKGEETWYINRLTGGLVTMKPKPIENHVGGLLAEEMGLGKTLECLSLIMLNSFPDRLPVNKRWDEEAKVIVSEIKCTLIVTPTSLLTQWADEIKYHAPSLRALNYEGWAKFRRDKAVSKSVRQGHDKGKVNAGSREIFDEVTLGPEMESFAGWAEYVNTFDIVLTTFAVLQTDLGVARAPVIRPRRATVLGSYSNDLKRVRSPLVMVEWARVIMDEVQLFGGRAAEMMSLIPRVHSLAVSGTPARGSITDLLQVLRFLKIGEAVTSPRHWKRLLTPGFSDVFRDLFQCISIRTLKSQVQDELTIPSQKRYAVGVEMGKVERHVYDEAMRQALGELGLTASGIIEGELNVPLLRQWLRKLRAVATHPQVGRLGVREKILGDEGHLKTIAEVLKDMQIQAQRSVMDAQKSKILASIRKAQLLQKDQRNMRRYQDSREVLVDSCQQADDMLRSIQTYLQGVQEEADRVMAKKNGPRFNLAAIDDSALVSSNDTNDHGFEDGRFPKTKVGEELRARHQALQSRLRECQVLRHKIIFLLGDVYNVLGNAEEERMAYEQADNIRKKLLQVTEQAALRAMEILAEESKRKNYDPEKEMEIFFSDGEGGKQVKMAKLEVNEVTALLTAQRDLLLEWRLHIISLLTQPLSSKDGDVEADGQEYARALDTQGEVEQYLQAYAALLADRREAYKAERTALAAHENKITKLRQTKAAARAAAIDTDSDDCIPIEAKPEHEVLRAELALRRTALRGSIKCKALKTIMVSLNTIASGLRDKDPEKDKTLHEVSRLRKIMKDQEAAADKLDAELAHFRKAFNDRVLYFKQLQEVSDSVAEIELEGTWQEDLANAVLDIEENERNIAKKQQHLGYLNSLNTGNDTEEDEGCIICAEIYESGWIFECAHRCCERCLTLLEKKHKSCPICRKLINFDKVRRVVTDKAQSSVSQDAMEVNQVPEWISPVEYNRMPPEMWQEIKEVETFGSYGSKIETLVKHLVWLQEHNTGTKSIVFSAWADSLAIIEHALIGNGIPCLQVKAVRGKKNTASEFKSNPDIFVFLLHGERENAGLNLTEAKRVFCLEPVVNHAFETQAIARIDRMGQSGETEVYCYYSENTVERNILDLGARQGVSLYTQDRAVGTLLNTNASDHQSRSKQIDSLKKGKTSKGDFVHSAEDMVAILFPHLYDEQADEEDEETPEDIIVEDLERTFRTKAGKGRRREEQPVASTSRTMISTVA